MIDLATYLNYTKNSELFSSHIDEIRAYNYDLIKKYPWLKIKNPDDFDPYPDAKEKVEIMEDYNFTWLDDMPTGWRLAFGEQMCEEIQQELERVNYVDEYDILQIKEKYGSLRWYTGAIPIESLLYEIVEKYEYLSEKTCIECGNPATYMTTGWIMPICEDCKNKILEENQNLTEKSFVKIKK